MEKWHFAKAWDSLGQAPKSGWLTGLGLDKPDIKYDVHFNRLVIPGGYLQNLQDTKKMPSVFNWAVLAPKAAYAISRALSDHLWKQLLLGPPGTNSVSPEANVAFHEATRCFWNRYKNVPFRTGVNEDRFILQEPENVMAGAVAETEAIKIAYEAWAEHAECEDEYRLPMHEDISMNQLWWLIRGLYLCRAERDVAYQGLTYDEWNLPPSLAVFKTVEHWPGFRESWDCYERCHERNPAPNTTNNMDCRFWS